MGPVILEKHFTEMSLFSDEKKSFVLGHIQHDHGHDEALQII